MEPVANEALALAGWVVSINEFNDKTAALNKRAAQLTAISVVPGAFTTIVSVALPLITH
ncbi:MAG TPA: hypothetical protein VG105_17100 [Paraburkholderia sp.]|nr:hypothetical protein [Paraburkholderia sp.]